MSLLRVGLNLVGLEIRAKHVQKENYVKTEKKKIKVAGKTDGLSPYALYFCEKTDSYENKPRPQKTGIFLAPYY